jgi:hypothetical protein
MNEGYTSRDNGGINEQIKFPSRTTIAPGELPPETDSDDASSYDGGTIEISDNCTVFINGFGRTEPSEFAPPQPDENYYIYENGQNKKRQPPRFPLNSEKLETFKKYPPNAIEDVVNMHFYFEGGSILEEMLDAVPETNSDLRNKILIITKGFRNWNNGVALINERPDLKTAIILDTFRDYVIQAGHCKSELVIPFLLSHPEEMEIIPENYKQSVSGLFFLWWHRSVHTRYDLSKVWNKYEEKVIRGKENEWKIVLSKMKQDFFDDASKLNIDPNIPGLKAGLKSLGFNFDILN